MLNLSKQLLWRLLTLALLGIMLLAAVPRAQAVSNNGDNRHGVDLASPAVVRIITTIKGQVVCNGCGQDGGTLTFPQDQSMSYEVYSSGSGALINPNGYILTADHVVNPQQNNLVIQSILLQDAIQDYAKDNNISKDDATKKFTAMEDNLTYSYSVKERDVFLSSYYTGSNTEKVNVYRVSRVLVPNTPPAPDDVAIIKIDAEQDLPYLSLAPESKIQTQDNVTAITFSGDVETIKFSYLADQTLRSQLNPSELTSLLTPTVENGTIVKENQSLPTGGGTTTASVVKNIASRGSSGGPVINGQGQIIGFVHASPSKNPDYVYLIPSSTVIPHMKETNIASPDAGAFMSLWTKALNEYYGSGACHWTNASKDLKELHDKYPQFGGIQKFLSDAQTNTTPSECPPPSSSAINWPLLLGLGALIIVLASLGVFQGRRIPFLAGAQSGTKAATTPTSIPVHDETADMGGQQGEIAPSTTVPLPPPEVVTIARKCTSGHVVALETASFCPTCGAQIEKIEAQEEKQEFQNENE